jgi:two-component system, chemotaxis family, sensor histidine kinase and response regulator WspE
MIDSTPNPVRKKAPDITLIHLFCSEIRMQLAVLNPALLKLEAEGPHPETLAALMRGAHSLKGAARMVHIDLVVILAHEMEDYFVAVQQGRLQPQSVHCDSLFKSLDCLEAIATRLEHFPTDTLIAETPAIQRCATTIAELHSPQVSPIAEPIVELITKPIAEPILERSTIDDLEIPLNITPTPAPIPEILTRPDLPSQGESRTVRLSRESLSRLMGLAGESMTEATWLDPFGRSLLQIKSQQSTLIDLLDQLQAQIPQTLDPKLQTLLTTARITASRCRRALSDRTTELDDFSRRSTQLADRLYQEVVHSQMRPFSDTSHSFPRMVRDLARQVEKSIKLEISGNHTLIDRDILERLESPLTHLLNNAIDHGIEPSADRIAAGKPAYGTLHLTARHRAGTLIISLEDDGYGIDITKLRQQILDRHLATPEMVARLSEPELLEFLYLPGFSTAPKITKLSGRGVGLDIVHNLVHNVGGSLKTTTELGKGTTFFLHLPLTLSVLRTLVVEIAGHPYAFPMTRLDRVLTLPVEAIQYAENRPYFHMGNQPIGLLHAHQVLNLTESASTSQLSVLMLGDRDAHYGLIVDRILGEEKLVIKPLHPRLGKVPNLSATALRSDGSIVFILDSDDLLQSMKKLQSAGRWDAENAHDRPRERKKILVIDDSITVRETERKLLENQGYQVDTAVNGADGWNTLQLNAYDLVVTDIDMPRMNGIELVSQMKRHHSLQTIPTIIISYKDREEDRRQGLEVGANYYLTKSSFQDDTLVQAVLDLIGPAIETEP